MEEQVCVIYAGVNGYLDPLTLDKVKPFEDALLANLRTSNTAILSDIRDTKDLTDATANKLKAVVETVSKQFI
jgi:F-type H+-transporting ATPase subunit alpha